MSCSLPTGIRVLITAGPTAEDIDPVRFITNRSSGRMGVEMAGAVLAAGGVPCLVLGPTSLEPPTGVETIRVRSAASMHAAVVAKLAWMDCLVMAAAVADYTPAETLDAKLKKKDGDLFLRLKRTVDILADIAQRPERQGKLIIGYSLDVDLNIDEGRRKLRRKNLDWIVVNTTASFGSREERAILVGHDEVIDYGEISKQNLAGRLVDIIAAWSQAR